MRHSRHIFKWQFSESHGKDFKLIWPNVKRSFSHALAEKLGIGTVPNWETLLAPMCWLQAQSQDPLKQWVRPLVCMPDPKWPCMSLSLPWNLQVSWFSSMLQAMDCPVNGDWVIFILFLTAWQWSLHQVRNINVTDVINFEYQSHFNYFLLALLITPILLKRQLYLNIPQL